VAGGGTLTAPLMVTNAGDGSGRLFIVDQIGLIRVIDADGNLLPAPFLDIASKVVSLGIDFGGGFVFDERGLLGVAFHPDYANNGRFFVRYSAPRSSTGSEPCDPANFPFMTVGGDPVGCHKEVLAEYAVTGDPNLADPDSEIILFEVDEPQFNHNSGHVAFGPDGLLYWTLGDGGGGNDGLADDPPSHGPDGNGQNPDTPLGNILRIDVDCLTPPCVPAGNPFAGVCPAEFPSCVPEIYAFGFRNPYRFSFGQVGGTDFLIVGDVGQLLIEEVDFVPVLASPGFLNYGWVIREGTQCFDPLNPGTPPGSCPTTGPLSEPLIGPELEYGHDIGIAVVGGYIYQGSYPPLQGRYVFGDFSQDFGPTGRLFYADVEGPEAFVQKEFFLAPGGLPLNQAMFGFGVGEDGEMYVCASDNIGPVGDVGVVYKIVAPAPSQSTLAARYLSIEPPPSPEPYALAVTPDCPAGPPVTEVAAVGTSFMPPDVTIGPGDSVHWSGLAGGFHNVAETDSAVSVVYNGGFRSAAAADEFTHVFSDPGVFYYICEPHVGAGMRGTVTVTGSVLYLGPTTEVVTNTGPESISFLVSDPNDAARLTSAEWGAAVHVTGVEIYPVTGYKIQTDFGTAGSPVLSEATPATTQLRGDVVAPFGGVGQPNFQDIGAIVNKYKNLFTAPPLHRADQVGEGGTLCLPNQSINFQDINNAVQQYKLIPFPCPGPCE
jgi:plastocyanin/glucose/arabinose dehydrogenase